MASWLASSQEDKLVGSPSVRGVRLFSAFRHCGWSAMASLVLAVCQLQSGLGSLTPSVRVMPLKVDPRSAQAAPWPAWCPLPERQPMLDIGVARLLSRPLSVFRLDLRFVAALPLNCQEQRGRVVIGTSTSIRR